MRVLLVSEGIHEQRGALEALVRQLSPHGFEFEHAKVSRNDIHAHHGKGGGYFKRAIRWMLEAEERGFDAIVLLIDQDGHAVRSQEIDHAQAHALGVERRALGVAIRTFDAGMLSDETALSSVLSATVPRQRQPESMRDPKNVLIALAEASDSPTRLRDLYTSVAQSANLDTLRERCPSGFAPFAERVTAM